MCMLKQCKAYDIKAVKETINVSGWTYSIKYDGNYVQIYYDVIAPQPIRFFTSGGKEFANTALADELHKYFKHVFGVNRMLVECEYLGSGEGKFGERGLAAEITTLRTEFAKGKECSAPQHKIAIFDAIPLDYLDMQFSDRHKLFIEPLKSLLREEKAKHIIASIDTLYNPDELVSSILPYYLGEGWEGLMLKSPQHVYKPGKRVKTALKFKSPRLCATLTCIGGTEGRGKYEGQIGALLLRDEVGREVYVGSGLHDSTRCLPLDSLRGKDVVIMYERIAGNTYIQPTLLHIKE